MAEHIPDKAPLTEERYISQIPALQLLQKLGYTYLSPEEVREERGARLDAVLLEGILTERLRAINRIHFKGREHPFSEGNIASAVGKLKDTVRDGLAQKNVIFTNEKIHDLLCLGQSFLQSIAGNSKSFPLHYIDWKNIGNNAFHVAEEFSVTKKDGRGTRRPDIVLFINGIPLVVIECKAPSNKKPPMDEAIAQHLENQRLEETPALFSYSQLLLAISTNEAKYGTAGTTAKFWSVWKEKTDIDKTLRTLINRPPTDAQQRKLFAGKAEDIREHFARQAEEEREEEREEGRKITEQDRALYCLCRPERLLEFMRRYTIFEKSEKKIARYQQYFCVKEILALISERKEGAPWQGGVVWHTQGSGKSLTMVMLARGIALKGLDNAKIILVSDRINLDNQIHGTFKNCGMDLGQAKTGKRLADLLTSHREQIIATVIHKFETVVEKSGIRDENPNIFVLVDEAHRSQSGNFGPYGALHSSMRRALPNACFIGFTGTPLLEKDKKNSLKTFGGIIDNYLMRQAVKDKAVVPLLYEGRHAPQKVDKESVDMWFERATKELSEKARADLKKKFSTADQINKTEQKVMQVAWDISEHYCNSWQNKDAKHQYKAQLVAPDKSTAILYKKCLDRFGKVNSEVLISPPGDYKGSEEVGENVRSVQLFWEEMMARFTNEKNYKERLIELFKSADKPEIIIVVDMLLTGFDAPCNTVLYLTRQMKGHTLFQAIGRVNRLYEGKEFGYIIDYCGVLENLNEALDIYGSLSEFDRKGLDDLSATLTDIRGEVEKLPQRHSDLWELFKEVENKNDEEEYERLLANEKLRAKFRERLSLYSRTLAVALSSVSFPEETPKLRLEKYKSDLKFFMKLSASVSRRYAEVIDFKEYESRIQKLLNTHVSAGEIEQVTELVDIFDEEAFATEVGKLKDVVVKADTIAHRTKKTIADRAKEDPAFYGKFSELLEKTIEDHRQGRITDSEYYDKVVSTAEKVRNRTGDDVPNALKHNKVAQAFYGILPEVFKRDENADNSVTLRDIGANFALRIDEIIRDHLVVDWVRNTDAQNRMKDDIDDYLYKLKEKWGVNLASNEVEEMLERCLDIARNRYANARGE